MGTRQNLTCPEVYSNTLFDKVLIIKQWNNVCKIKFTSMQILHYSVFFTKDERKENYTTKSEGRSISDRPQKYVSGALFLHNLYRNKKKNGDQCT